MVVVDNPSVSFGSILKSRIFTTIGCYLLSPWAGPYAKRAKRAKRDFIRGSSVPNLCQTRAKHRPHHNRRWQRVRLQQLTTHPLCTACKLEGRLTAADQVHHVQRIEEGVAMYDPANLESLCATCHTHVTNATTSTSFNGRRWPIDPTTGEPTDPAHHWRRT